MSKQIYVILVVVMVAVTGWFTNIAASASYEKAVTVYQSKPVAVNPNPFLNDSPDASRRRQYGPSPTFRSTGGRIWQIGIGIIVLEVAAAGGLYSVLQRRGTLF